MKYVRLSETLLEILDETHSLWGEQRELTPKEILVRKALKFITDKQRDAVMFDFYWGYSDQKIADILKISISSVRDRKRLALINLRDILGPVLFPYEFDNWSPLLNITKDEFERKKEYGAA